MQHTPSPNAPLDDDADFHRWYGRWRRLTPRGAQRLMRGAGIPWWIIGGWAIDAFTGQPRVHEDIDISIFTDDLHALVAHLGADYCLWACVSGVLSPLRTAADLPDGCHQLWLRRDAQNPWLADFALNPRAQNGEEQWVSRRDKRIRLPLAQATFEKEGVRYLRPEVMLLMKARHARPKDERDLEVVLPLLDNDRQAWLATALEIAHPGHAWRERLGR
jgi:hypothetical protein